MPRRRPDFESGVAGAEAAQPERLGDAGGSQKRWLSDAALGPPKIVSIFGVGRRQNQFSNHERYTRVVFTTVIARNPFS